MHTLKLVIEITSKLSCFTMLKRERPHVPWRDVLMAYTHGFCARLSAFYGNNTWQMKNFTARYPP